MNLEKENDYTTYLFTLSSLGLILSQVFFKGQYDNIIYLGYALTGCGFFFIYQFFKLSSLKKELIRSDKKLLNKITKDGSPTINVILIFNNSELFEKSKNRNIYNKYELAKKSILFSFYSTIILITCFIFL